MTVIPFWNYLLPSAFPFVCSCFGELLGDGGFGNSRLEPDFIALFPPQDASYPGWGRILTLGPFRKGSPSISIYR